MDKQLPNTFDDNRIANIKAKMDELAALPMPINQEMARGIISDTLGKINGFANDFTVDDLANAISRIYGDKSLAVAKEIIRVNGASQVAQIVTLIGKIHKQWQYHTRENLLKEYLDEAEIFGINYTARLCSALLSYYESIAAVYERRRKYERGHALSATGRLRKDGTRNESMFTRFNMMYEGEMAIHIEHLQASERQLLGLISPYLWIGNIHALVGRPVITWTILDKEKKAIKTHSYTPLANYTYGTG